MWAGIYSYCIVDMCIYSSLLLFIFNTNISEYILKINIGFSIVFHAFKYRKLRFCYLGNYIKTGLFSFHHISYCWYTQMSEIVWVGICKHCCEYSTQKFSAFILSFEWGLRLTSRQSGWCTTATHRCTMHFSRALSDRSTSEDISLVAYIHIALACEISARKVSLSTLSLSADENCALLEIFVQFSHVAAVFVAPFVHC